MVTRKRKTQQEPDTEIIKGVDEPERFKLGEIGYSGLKMFDGIVELEMVNDLKYPTSNKTYRQMLLHPAVNAPINLHKTMVSKATYRLIPPKDATDEERRRTEIIHQILFQDMEHPFEDLITQAMTMLDYGFAPVEKVYRRRTSTAGSMFDDGLIGVRKLSLRHQESIVKYTFKDDGETVEGIKQDKSLISDPFHRSYIRNTVVIPRSKMMLFVTGDLKSNPYGTSPLRNVYLPWKYLQAIEELEATGVAKDLQGIPVMRVPPQYLTEDASPAEKRAGMHFQNILRNIQANSQSSVLLPQIFDPETRQPLFDIELLSNDGKKNYDTDKIKDYYRTMIFIGLAADILLQGNTNVGSFALGVIKNSLTGNAVERYLREIMQVVNSELIRDLYQLNGWDASRACTIDYEGFEDVDLETYGKTIQRMAATGMLPVTLDVVNSNLRKLGIDALPYTTTQAELEALLHKKTSKSGKGMESGMNSGTGDAVGDSGNASDMNADNAA